jgi:hypothetical protein
MLYQYIRSLKICGLVNGYLGVEHRRLIEKKFRHAKINDRDIEENNSRKA